MRLNYFANDKYRVLAYLYNNSIEKDKKLLYRGNQQKIADEISFSKGKVNILMQELCKNGFIQLLNKRMGLYEIKEKAVKVLDKLSEKI